MKRGFIFRMVNVGGITFPTDKELHGLAVKYAEQNLNSPVNFADYETITVTCIVDESGKPLEATALNARVARWDYPIWRYSDDESGKVLIERTRASLDEQGQRGGEVFVHIADREKPESRCPKWRKFLKLVGAQNASRWRVRI